VLSAYAASASRIGSWVVVSTFVFRTLGPDEFGVLALIRGTIGLLNYVSFGLGPAFIRQAAEAKRETVGATPHGLVPDAPTPYHTPPPAHPASLKAIYSNSLFLMLCAGIVGIAICSIYAIRFDQLYRVPQIDHLTAIVWVIGIGTLLRLIGDAPGGVLQLRGRISTDNTWLIAGDLLWILLTLWNSDNLLTIAILFCASGGVTLAGRWLAAGQETGVFFPTLSLNRLQIQKQLLAYGGMIVAAQLADYLYSPTDYILIDRLLSPHDLASYAPAVQIDSALLLLVGGLSAVLLPKAALAHAERLTNRVRRYYLRGTLAGFALLLPISMAIWLFSPMLFRLWLGESMPQTQALLPLMLANSVIGGSSAVGRSILLAIGKARAFAVSVLIAGVVNVICSIVFVVVFHWGLNGIVLGTVVAVIGRCLIWMPWYVLRNLRQATDRPPSDR
jgi:O-antigen/teichoic acid export membrane protein